MTDSPEREQISRELAKELGCEIGVTNAWKMILQPGMWVIVPEKLRDALISREVRVRELEAALAEISRGNRHVWELVAMARIALHTKEEKG